MAEYIEHMDHTHQVSKNHYSSFMLVMLILSSIVTALMVIITLLGAAVILSRNSLGANTSWHTIVGLSLRVLITFGSVAALAILWMRKKEGIILKFVLLGLTILASLIGTSLVHGRLFDDQGSCVAPPVNYDSYRQFDMRYSNECNDSRAISNAFGDLGDNLVVVGVILSIFWNSGVAVLWFFAWRSQEKQEGITKFLGNSNLIKRKA